MRKVWNILLAPLMIFVGTLIAPDYVIVTDKLSYLWVLLLQIPVTAIAIAIIIGLMFLIVWHWRSFASAIIVVILSFILGAAVGTLGFYLIDLILPGLTINSIWAYVLMGLVYGLLSVEVKAKKKNEDD